MLVVVGTVRLPAANLDAARPVMKRMVDASRSEHGCIEYVYSEDLFDPGLIHVKEVWTDREALDSHLTSAQLLEWRAAWPGLAITDRELHVHHMPERQMI